MKENVQELDVFVCLEQEVMSSLWFPTSQKGWLRNYLVQKLKLYIDREYHIRKCISMRQSIW